MTQGLAQGRRRAVATKVLVFFPLMVLGIISLYRQNPTRFLVKNESGSISPILVQQRASSNASTTSLLAHANEHEISTRKEESRRLRLTLPEIARSHENYTCPDGLVFIHDTVLPDYDSPVGRRIPKVVHMTAKSRCLTPAFAKNVEKWRLPGHSFFFHDDRAVDRFIHQKFGLFPHFSLVMKCITSGAAKADLWRYLLIWEHGGIYTDFDNAPTSGFQQGKAIQPTHDAWMPLEAMGILAQYFFAASPLHPIMYLSLHSGLTEIWALTSIHRNRAPYTTGPHAIKIGTIDFLKAAGMETNGYIEAGEYVGMNNRTITVVGNKTNPHEFVNRGGIPNKHNHYEKMGMKHFTKDIGTQRHSCVEHILLEHDKEMKRDESTKVA